MNRDKMMALVLLDACAFACAQDSRKETRREFEMACEFAERLSLPEVKTYRDFVASYERETPRRKRPGSKRLYRIHAETASSAASL